MYKPFVNFALSARRFFLRRPAITSQPAHVLHDFLTAIIGVLAIAGVRFGLDQWLNGQNSYTLFLVAVLVVSSTTGVRAGLFSLIASVFVTNHFFVSPQSRFFTGNFLEIRRLLDFVLAGIVLLYFLYRQQALQANLEAEIARRQEQEALAEKNAERFRLASEAINGLFYDWDVKTGHVLRTRGLREILGYEAEDAEPTREWWIEQIHPDDLPNTLDWNTVLQTSIEAYSKEYRVQHRLGYYITLLDKGRILREPDGTPIRAVGCSVDVTEQRRAEAALRENEERLRLAITGAEMGTWHWNLQDNSIELSPRCRELFGIEPGEPFDGELWRQCIHTEDREWVNAARSLAIQARQDFDVEHRILWPEGQVRYVAVRGHAFYNADGSPLRMEGIALDVTERHRALNPIEQLNVRLQRAMAESHHRIKNNLQTLAALAEMQTLDGNEMLPTEAFQRITQHIRTLAALHDLLTTEVRESRDVETISLPVALSKLTNILQTVSAGRRVLLEADEVRLPLKQAGSFTLLVNELVSNAVKHGKGTIYIQLSVVEGTDNDLRSRIRLLVRDEGPGFPPDFDPLRAANTGLELIESISRWDLQGDIDYTNAVEGGACVIVTFPVLKV